MDQCAVDIKKQKTLCTCCHSERSRAIPLHHLQVCHGLTGAQSFGACINSTAIMLPRNTSSTIARPINIALRIGSFSCLSGRSADVLGKSTDASLLSTSVVSEKGSSGMLPILIE